MPWFERFERESVVDYRLSLWKTCQYSDHMYRRAMWDTEDEHLDSQINVIKIMSLIPFMRLQHYHITQFLSHLTQYPQKAQKMNPLRQRGSGLRLYKLRQQNPTLNRIVRLTKPKGLLPMGVWHLHNIGLIRW